MRSLLFFFLLIGYNTFIKAQLDLEHWFPPLYRSSNYLSNYAEINVSTPHKTPFRIYIYSNNILQESLIISKDNPAKYIIKNSSYITTAKNSFKTNKNGIHIVGENSFFSDLRLKKEIVLSFGKTSLGTEFRSVNTTNNNYEGVDEHSLMTSIMATKDNTTINFSGFDAKITFADGRQYNSPITINLNKDESFIIAAYKKDNFNIFDNEYFNTINGSKISSDKPIVVFGGAFYGQYAYENGSNSLLLDHIPPINKLGKNFFFQKGFSAITKHTEKAFIVATKNNTKVYFNNDTTARVILNDGDYYLMNIKDFINNQVYIKSSEPIYCYQLSSGTNRAVRNADFSYDAESMAYIPPLDISLPGEIDMIPNIDLIDNTTNRTFLNILIPKGNNLNLNNSTINASNGPFNLVGNSEWDFYTFPDLKGNASISSQNGLIAGLIGGNSNDLIGYSGYITGFSNDPKIKINGNCIEEGITLQLTNTDFDKIQWQKDGIDIPNANSGTYIPTVAGNYRCVLTYSGIQYITESIKIINCPYVITDVLAPQTCEEFSIIPKFSTSKAHLTINQIIILTQPSNGTIKIEDSTIKYTANKDFVGNDRFVYQICNSNGYCETFKITIPVKEKPEITLANPLLPIQQTKDFVIFNLTQALKNNSTQYNYEYYEDVDLKFKIANPTQFQTKNNIAYVKATNNYGCSNVGEIELEWKPYIEDELSLSNFFSPNGDGLNDYWDYSELKFVDLEKLEIYNRYSELVFKHTLQNIDYKWNGFGLNKALSPIGSYWIIIQYKDKNGELKEKNMWVLLKRF